ncbi:MAG: phosphatidate cytidylyltransferase [Bacteroidales bacterium]|nr:phosphatidate cytidylyltransferase [Bacteroidales bacterium]
MKNLIIRTISGLAFIIIMIGGILWGVLPYAVIMGLIIAMMMNEYINISVGKKFLLHKWLAIATGELFFILLLLVKMQYLETEFLLLAFVPLIFIFIANLYVKDFNRHQVEECNGAERRVANGFELTPFILSSILYIAIPMSTCNFVIAGIGEEVGYSGAVLLSMFIILWATDVGAYCLGSTLGQRFGKKLFPSISPKKSWIGFLGGLICAVLAAYLLQFVDLLPISMLSAVVLGIIICIFGVWGDLVESQLKRNFGVKDSGSIMPGHGGMLDRFDGALTAFPMAVIYLSLFV